MHSIRLGASIAILFSLGGLFAPRARAEIIHPGSQLARAGYSADPTAVIEYLRNGLPRESSPPRNEHSYTPARLPFVRWDFYPYSAGVLFEHKTSEAVPILATRLAEPLPEFMLNDLFIKVASESYRSRVDDWDDWDLRAAEEIMNFRWEVARALVEADKEIARSALLTALRRDKDAVKAAILMERDNYLYVHRYAGICSIAARAGLRDGIDALIELLPLAKGRNSGNIPTILLHLTGAEIAIPENTTESDYGHYVEQWNEWWVTNRESFTIPPSPAIAAPIEKPRLESVRDYVDAASKNTLEIDYIRPTYPETLDWLEKNGSKHGRKLRSIAEDRKETLALRRTSTQWYARTAGEEALGWLRNMLLKNDEMEFSEEERLDPGFLFNVLKQCFPASLDDVARECIEREAPSAPAAVDRLLDGHQGEKHAAFILEHYDDLVRQFPDIRHRIVHQYRYKPTPGDEKVLVDCLVNGDFGTAVFAAAAVRSRGIEKNLPNEAQRALQEWQENLSFLLAVLEYDEDKDLRRREAAQISRRVSGSDVHAAHAYARAYALLTDQFAGPVTPEAEFCVEGLRRCIAAYRARRNDMPGGTVQD